VFYPLSMLLPGAFEAVLAGRIGPVDIDRFWPPS
jgi:hypothetical protein